MTKKNDFESIILALFEALKLCQFTKYNNFIWLQLIFEQNTCFLGSIKRETPWRNRHYCTPHGTVDYAVAKWTYCTNDDTAHYFKAFFCHWLAAIALPFRNVPKVNLIAHDTSKHKKLNLVFLQQFGQKKVEAFF